MAVSFTDRRTKQVNVVSTALQKDSTTQTQAYECPWQVSFCILNCSAKTDRALSFCV